MSVNLEDYTTINGLARIVKIPPPRAHRIVRFLGLTSYKVGRQILIRKSMAERVRRAIDEKEFPSGPKSKEKKRGLALRAAPKRRVTQ